MMDVREWLESIGFGQHIDAFAENDIDGELLRDLLDADLVTLGVSPLGHRKRLLKAIADLGSEGQADDSIASGSPMPSGRIPCEPERRQLTVMFCDLVGSVALGEHLDVEDYRQLLGRFRRRPAPTRCRKEAELLLADTRESRQGEVLLMRAIELTRARGAKSLELRAAPSVPATFALSGAAMRR